MLELINIVSLTMMIYFHSIRYKEIGTECVLSCIGLLDNGYSFAKTSKVHQLMSCYRSESLLAYLSAP
jgi:hypothetical protein